MSKPVQFCTKKVNLCLKNTESEKFKTLFDKLAELSQQPAMPGFMSVQRLGAPASEIGVPRVNEPMSSSITDNKDIVPKTSGLENTGRDSAHLAVNNPIQKGSVSTPPTTQKITQIPRGRLAKPFSKMAGYSRNTGIVDVDGDTYINTEDTELLGKLGFDVTDYRTLEKSSEVLDLYSYIEKYAGVPKAVSKAVDKGEAFSGSFLKDMDYSVPEGYEMKGDLCCPVDKTEKQSAEKPGLWDNIRAKRARGEKPAKPGDKDYPDKEQWDKLSKESAASPAWQRSEGKNPEGGLNAKGRASYKRETGGTLKAPVTESNPKGERASRQNSFCSRMCGMKRVNTGSKAKSDPDSRINKSLRKWNCKCGEEHGSLYEKVACLVKEASPSTRRIMTLLQNADEKTVKSIIERLANYGAKTRRNIVTGDEGLLHTFKNNVSEKNIRDLMTRGTTSPTGANTAAEQIQKVLKDKADQTKILAQFKSDDANLKDVLFTPQFGLTEPKARAQRLAASQRHPLLKKLMSLFGEATIKNNNPVADLPNFETVLSKGNLVNPSKRLSTTQYFVPSREGVAGAVPSSSLPASDKGYMYKGGKPASITRAKNLPTSSDSFFFSGAPQVAADYASPSTYVKPVNFSQLRKHVTIPSDTVSAQVNSYHQPKVNYPIGISKEAKGRCWEGYEPVPGKEPYSEDSCKPKTEEKKKEKKADLANTNPIMTGGNFVLSNNPINIPTENLAQKDNRPSMGKIFTDTLQEGGNTNIDTVENVRDSGSAAVGSTTAGGTLHHLLQSRFPGVAPRVANVGKFLGKFSPGAGAFSSATSVNKRLNQTNPDYTGAALDTVSGIGSALEATPLAPIGLGLNLTGTGLNLGRDYHRAMLKSPGAPYISTLPGKPIEMPFSSPIQPVQPVKNNPIQIKQTLTQSNALPNTVAKQAAAEHPLKSSNIKAVGYNKENKTLEIAFHSGGNYTYKDVPKSLFERIKKVKSPGEFFHRHIRKNNDYEYSKLDKEAAKKIPKLQQLLPGMEEWVKKQPFNHAEELFRQGKITASHRDKWMSGRMAEEFRPKFEEMMRILREGPPKV
jgi:hypothetical protein